MLPKKVVTPQKKEGRHLSVVVVVIPPLPRDGGMARTAIKDHAVNLMELG